MDTAYKTALEKSIKERVVMEETHRVEIAKVTQELEMERCRADATMAAYTAHLQALNDEKLQAVEAEASTLKAAQLEHAAELAQKEVRLKAHRDELLAQLKRALESKAQAVFDASGREAALNAEIDLVRFELNATQLAMRTALSLAHDAKLSAAESAAEAAAAHEQQAALTALLAEARGAFTRRLDAMATELAESLLRARAAESKAESHSEETELVRAELTQLQADRDEYLIEREETLEAIEAWPAERAHLERRLGEAETALARVSLAAVLPEQPDEDEDDKDLRKP